MLFTSFIHSTPDVVQLLVLTRVRCTGKSQVPRGNSHCAITVLARCDFGADFAVSFEHDNLGLLVQRLAPILTPRIRQHAERTRNSPADCRPAWSTEDALAQNPPCRQSCAPASRATRHARPFRAGPDLGRARSGCWHLFSHVFGEVPGTDFASCRRSPRRPATRRITATKKHTTSIQPGETQ